MDELDDPSDERVGAAAESLVGGPPGSPAEPSARPQTRASFAWRGSLVLAILGLISLLGGLWIAVGGDHSTGQLVMAAAAIVGSIGAFGLALGLRRGSGWASPWAKLALFIVAVVGIGHSVIGLANASIWIPLDTVLAVWALLAGDGTPQGRGLRRQPAGLGLVALIVLSEAAGPLGAAAAELAKPAPDPNAVVVVTNQSPRALIVLAGSLIGTRSASSFVAPCGGVARLPIVASDYESDGRLMVFLAIDGSGALDGWSADGPSGSDPYSGSYSILPIWSRGDLAGRLPLRLVVHHDFSVDSEASASTTCIPNPSAVPAGG